MVDKKEGIGYSEKINDKAFSKYLDSSRKWSLYFSFGLALIAIIGFFVYGQTSSDMDNPQALFIGLAIGGMFITIASIQNMRRNRSKTWDGVVVDKKHEKKKRRINSSDNENSQVEIYDHYTINIRSDEGKKHKITSDNDDTLYNYYHVGDKVRKHAGLNTYEKYDKSKDTIIFCNACGTLNSIEGDYCSRCKCPLLK